MQQIATLMHRIDWWIHEYRPWNKFPVSERYAEAFHIFGILWEISAMFFLADAVLIPLALILWGGFPLWPVALIPILLVGGSWFAAKELSKRGNS